MTVKIHVTGAVQGVGYRPFVAGLAQQFHISGYVQNFGGDVDILASCDDSCALQGFVDAIRTTGPTGSIVLRVTCEEAEGEVLGESGFAIRTSKETSLKELPVFPPDLGICPSCYREMQDPDNRRYWHGLISCTACGPRWSILKKLPYDRESTTMEAFALCDTCRAEYTGKIRTPRRRHAQTISCHDCGPQFNDLDKAIELLKADGVIALKGVGGYQLICAAGSREGAARIRQMKGREQKPFAVMFTDVTDVRRFAEVSEGEEKAIISSARPIVLLRRGSAADGLWDCAAGEPVSDYLGAFLPSQGAHVLLTNAVGPLIVTSANRSGMPIPIEKEDLHFAAGREPDLICDHARKILRPLDDSVVAFPDGKLQMIRRSRGYVPLPILSQRLVKTGAVRDTIFAAGADLKSCFAIGKGDRIILSQYFGDLDNYAILQNYRHEKVATCSVLQAVPTKVVCDMHPGYHSTQLAKEYAASKQLPLLMMQHHHAHAASVMAEHGLTSCVGLVLDGTGFGTDGQLWGGEVMWLRGSEFTREGNLSYVTLTGGDRVSLDADLAADCYRVAMGQEAKRPEVQAALQMGIRTIQSSSAGRLFDAVSALLDICHFNSYEGACAISLEQAAGRALRQAENHAGNEPAIGAGINHSVAEDKKEMLQAIRARVATWEPYFPDLTEEDSGGKILLSQISLVRGILAMRQDGFSEGECALAFHDMLSAALCSIVASVCRCREEQNVALSGGCFANRILLNNVETLLRDEGLSVYRNELVPENDGGIALGQAYLAAMQSRTDETK